MTSRETPQSDIQEEDAVPFTSYETDLHSLNFTSDSDATSDVEGKYATKVEIDRINNLMIGVIIAFLVAFIALVITLMLSNESTLQEKKQATEEKIESYNQLRDKIDSQNDQLVNLRLDLQQAKNDLNNTLDEKANK